MDASLRRALAVALGPGSVLQDGSVLAPGSAEGVQAVLRIAQEWRLPLHIASGAGDASDAPEGGAVLSLGRLTAIAVDAANGIARAEAGATVAALIRSLAAARVAVAGLGGHAAQSRVGSLVGAGGLPRRSLCGLEAALPGGDLVRAGAAVLKDVVGYDVTSLLLGSAGRLAAVVAVQLRLTPAGARAETVPAAGVRPTGEVAAVFDPLGILAGG
ncbi:MAG: FAD-binding protein [Candidatus Dormibacteria bacterium]